MHRKLFCQLGPAAYAVSVAKQCAVRRLQDVAARTPLPRCVCPAGFVQNLHPAQALAAVPPGGALHQPPAHSLSPSCRASTAS